jgi:hypothetical protein
MVEKNYLCQIISSISERGTPQWNKHMELYTGQVKSLKASSTLL